MSDEKQLAITLPGEWALKKVMGPALDELGEDMKKLYSIGRDKIFIAGYKKIADVNDGKKANLRVVRDVFWNGSFTDESICAEYFGGILATSRSADGKDDTGVYFVDIIKSLSSKQLYLHYVIYSSLNKLLNSDPENKKINPGQESELRVIKIFLSMNEVIKVVNNEDFGTDLHALHAKGLIGDFLTGEHDLKNGTKVPNVWISPKPLGIMLYAVAHNKFNEWRNFATADFGYFENIQRLQYFGKDIVQLLVQAGIKD
ncbi:MAG: hypothetical protein WC551_01430 [Patescibacteria group bacterium]